MSRSRVSGFLLTRPTMQTGAHELKFGSDTIFQLDQRLARFFLKKKRSPDCFFENLLSQSKGLTQQLTEPGIARFGSCKVSIAYAGAKGRSVIAHACDKVYVTVTLDK